MALLPTPKSRPITLYTAAPAGSAGHVTAQSQLLEPARRNEIDYVVSI